MPAQYVRLGQSQSKQTSSALCHSRKEMKKVFRKLGKSREMVKIDPEHKTEQESPRRNQRTGESDSLWSAKCRLKKTYLTFQQIPVTETMFLLGFIFRACCIFLALG